MREDHMKINKNQALHWKSMNTLLPCDYPENKDKKVIKKTY